MLPGWPFHVEVEAFLLCQAMTVHIRGNFELETFTTKQAEGWMHHPPLCPSCGMAVCEGLHFF